MTLLMPARLAFGLALLSVPVMADGRTAAAPAAQWQVDHKTSSLRFQSSFAGANFNGSFRTWTAQIRFDPANLAGSSVRVAIDTASVATGDKDRDSALPGADWFASARHPQAAFAANRFVALGKGKYRADGALSLRGVTKPMSLVFDLRITGADAAMTGTATINRSAFGVGQGQFAAADTIPYPVKVLVAVNARRTP